MEPYPFDLYDWATITPLFEALLKSSVPQGGFADWLAQWNDLDIAVYDAWTDLKRRSYSNTTDVAAEHAYQVYTREIFSTYLGLTNALATRALAFQPEPPKHSDRQLWRRWRNQTALFNPESLVLQAEISERESGYRELTRHIEQLSGGDAVASWMERRMELNELMLRLLKLQQELARISGFPTFLAYRWRELNRLDFSIEECQTFHRIVEQVVVPLVTQLRAADGHVAEWPTVNDTTLLGDGVERILSNVDTAFGSIFHTMRPDYLGLGARPGKAVTSEQWFFPHVGMPYLHVASANPATLLHESGHAIHAYLSFQIQRLLWNFSAPEEFQEFVAIGMDMLCWPYYEQSQGGFSTETESAAARQRVLQYYLEAVAEA